MGNESPFSHPGVCTGGGLYMLGTHQQMLDNDNLGTPRKALFSGAKTPMWSHFVRTCAPFFSLPQASAHTWKNPKGTLSKGTGRK